MFLVYMLRNQLDGHTHLRVWFLVVRPRIRLYTFNSENYRNRLIGSPIRVYV